MNGEALRCAGNREWLIAVLHFCHFCGNGAVCKDNAICTEIVVCWTVVKITACCKERFAVFILLENRLVDEVPDKTALIAWLSLGKVGILEQRPVGVAHRVGVFAADERFFRMVFQELFDFGHRRIHLAFHVAGLVESAVIDNTLIVYQSGGIPFPELF